MSKPGSSYSSSRLDLSGESVAELTKGIATSQPHLEWLHAGNTLAIAKDPYLMAIVMDPVTAVSQIYFLKDPDGKEIGQHYLNALFQLELGHEVTEADFIAIGSKLFTWLKTRITDLRNRETIRFLSAADSAEKLIAGSLIKEAAEADERHTPDDDDTIN